MKEILKHEWISRMTMAMCATHPDVEKSKIEEMVAQIYAKRIKDTEVQILITMKTHWLQQHY